jgi:hypothetical protein
MEQIFLYVSPEDHAVGGADSVEWGITVSESDGEFKQESEGRRNGTTLRPFMRH